MLDLRYIAFAALMLVIGLSGPPALAQSLEDGIAALAAKSFSEKIAAVEALGARGDAKAETALSALLQGKLYRRKADDAVVIAEKEGKTYHLRDSLSGLSLGSVSKKEIKKIRVNNKLRGVIRRTLGMLQLAAPDAEVRSTAADAVFQSSDSALIAVLDRARQNEPDAGVRERLDRAWAAVVLRAHQNNADREDALIRLKDFADPDVQGLLSTVAASADDPLANDAQQALLAIEERLSFWRGVGNVFRGLSLGSVLLLAAVGLAITFGVMGVINMAHGELVMIGAYTTFVVQQILLSIAPAAISYSLLVAVPLAFITAGAVGILIERTIIQFLYGRPLETLLATWGISLILQQFVRTLFGPTNQEVRTPEWMSGAYTTDFGLVLTYNRITIILFALLVVAAIAVVTRYTAFGLHMRAVTQNRRMAGTMGIRTGWVDALTFGLGAGVAGVAGVALSQIDNVSPNLGQAYIIDSFMVVVFGGVGNLWGTLVGAFSLGIANKFLEPYAGAVLAKILVLVGIILFIQKRPRGLFALKGRAVEG